MHSTVTSKGQITLPKAIREKLHIGAGDRVEFVLETDGSVRMLVKHASVQRLRGILPKPETPVTQEAMEQAIRRGSQES